MRSIRFWGTRGSLPVALTAAGVRDKLARTLRDASGRTFESEEAIRRYVETLPKIGYRLTVPVTRVETSTESAPAPSPAASATPARNTRWLLVSAGLLAVSAVSLYFALKAGRVQA